MFGLGAGEIFIIFALALILIGPKKLPELAKGLGKAIREFQKTKNDLLHEVNHDSHPSKEEPVIKADEEGPEVTKKRPQTPEPSSTTSQHETFSDEDSNNRYC